MKVQIKTYTLKIGTRASKLALIQANIVANIVTAKLGCNYEIVPIKTSGDKELSKPLYDIGGKALFIKELENALCTGTIDIAVHSLKDMPGILPDGFAISAMLEREDPRDSLVSKVATTISDLPNKAVVGTSSPRRIAYLKHLRPDLEIVNLRGNVDTRFAKIMSDELDATILSYAGLKRLGIAPNKFCHPIDTSEMIPSIGQGTIAIETLERNKHIYSSLNHTATFDTMHAERAFLEHIMADCKTPAAAYARMEEAQLVVDFMLADDDMTNLRFERASGRLLDAYEIGKNMAKRMTQT